ncbi:MAG: c-type cytochrome [Acidobacteriaceae bacterium]|nr:c-type cytochrome [Acidobacteriaceae bacterium]
MIRRLLGFAGCVLVTTALTVAVAGAQKGKGDAAKGKQVFDQCAMCHNVDSPEKKMGPSLQHLFQHKTLANGKPVNDANVLAQINNGGNGMPPYNDMTPDDKANLLAYLHTL